MLYSTAWANGETAAHTQGNFAALTHNLLPRLLATLEKASITEQKVERKRATVLKTRPAHQRVSAQEMVRHATQLTCQFIRLVRHCLAHKTSWSEAPLLFERRLEAYL